MLEATPARDSEEREAPGRSRDRAVPDSGQAFASRDRQFEKISAAFEVSISTKRR